ncbi:exodeoxyribonuclease I [Testudinibacter sp. TR-2022]|uniref:exodeoxyribonuclease I n=1 Tax=Testudinibacter sp. TR-2022 TaxID=2585029 RepID=UPI00111A978C|nr:exodeoxyribonuclease I [Testudinibacter sp. TR-2022]TNH04714.1 exodeoxyribonuclease I [Pasteurellaceae bacterium Phil31]TNH05296.1 exodeoxyribonuclease I [Testudinibacter sp. TR-2022]TNH08989.1 exodeoxyribonuclease I [Testudinibacter sp. TR-2022]TNH15422.1 exodeoxyribonuclease I [Testudinibacter sp. TR-2022]TNH17122.1 exodeoxyribonuclease I [Testudinibacter sp. TR-2022]
MADFSFFIYDYESFGIDPARDRPAQFAGIRTDADFNIIGEPVMVYCKQTNDYLPAPEAVLVTGITPQECNEKGVSEPEFAARILQEFAQPNTCVMGYNSIRYDDEMTRYTFYRNFIDPYEYSWKNGNSRWDLLDVLRACYALRPEGINWVYDENGLPSFKLDRLTLANGIEHSNAHDAMADVYATIEMAKLVKAQQPRLFDYFFNLRSKKAVEALIDTANMTPLVHVSGMLGNYRGNTALVAPLAWHPSNNNAVIVCDLTADLSDLLSLDAETLKVRLYSKKAELEAQGILPVPLKLVHINKCPIVAPEKTLLPQSAERLGIDREQCLHNQQRLLQSYEIRDKVIAIFSEQREYVDDLNVETALYHGFFSDADKRNLQILRTLDAEQLKNPDLTFEDKRIPELLFHYRARHFYRTLNRAEQIKWQKYRTLKLEKNAETFVQSLQQLGEQHQNNPEKLALLQQVYEYGEKLLR